MLLLFIFAKLGTNLLGKKELLKMIDGINKKRISGSGYPFWFNFYNSVNLISWKCFFYNHLTAFVSGSVQISDCVLCFGIFRHFDKCKTFRPSCIAIDDKFYRINCSKLFSITYWAFSSLINNFLTFDYWIIYFFCEIRSILKDW